jgi:universal stress protein A
MASGWGRILVGLDFSPSSDLAFSYAVRLAEALGARLDLAHVHQPEVIPVPEMLLAPPDDAAAITAAQRQLQELAGRAASRRIQVQVHVRTDAPVMGLLQLIEELQPDLVVIGSHGRGALMRLLLGSTAEQLCRRSPVPVLVVPAPQRAAHAVASAA